MHGITRLDWRAATSNMNVHRPWAAYVFQQRRWKWRVICWSILGQLGNLSPLAMIKRAVSLRLKNPPSVSLLDFYFDSCLNR